MSAAKPPAREPARVLWYAKRIHDYMARPEWAWVPYQSLIYFLAAHKANLGNYGDVSVGRDTKLLRDAALILDADGIPMRDAIDLFFTTFRARVQARRRDYWFHETGWNVPAFKSALAGVKAIWFEEHRRQRQQKRNNDNEDFPFFAGAEENRWCAKRFECERFKRFRAINLEGERFDEPVVICEGNGTLYRIYPDGSGEEEIGPCADFVEEISDKGVEEQCQKK